MKTRMLSAVMAAFMLVTASVGGITASAAEKATAAEDTAETTAVNEDSSAETTETTVDTEESSDTEETSSVSDEADDMEKFREVMSELAEAGTTDVEPDYFGDPYYDTDGNATLIKSERIVYNSEEMQFIAVTTKDGHVFYVLINYSAENGQDNVYFLNRVDDYDLYALLYAGDEDKNSEITPEQAAQAAEKANGRVQSGDGTDTADTEETATDGEDTADSSVQAKPVPMNMNSMMLVFGAIALIGIGGVGFFLMKKKKGGSGKTAMQVEPEYDDENEITEDDDFPDYINDNSDDEI